MQRHMRRIALDLLHHAEVRRNYSIRTDLIEQLQKSRECRELRVARQRVACDMHFRTDIVCFSHRLTKPAFREIACCCAHAELLTRKINRICAEVQRHFQALQIPRRAKQFWSVCSFHSHSPHKSLACAFAGEGYLFVYVSWNSSGLRRISQIHYSR